MPCSSDQAVDDSQALLSVFKGRLADSRSGEGVVERCEASIEDENDEVQCRLVIKMFCQQGTRMLDIVLAFLTASGVIKTYQLTYESVEVMQAIFDRTRASNRWKIQAKMMREYADYFGPKTEQLDICYDQEQVILTSYTEKIVHGKGRAIRKDNHKIFGLTAFLEVLKQPLQTAVTIDPADFEEFDAQQSLHITISVRDFRAIIVHADTLLATVTALYSYPTQPLQFSYSGDGMRCEFTLMTIGDFRDSSASSVPRQPTRNPKRGLASFTTASEDSSTGPGRPRLMRAERPLGSQRPLGSRKAQAFEQSDLGHESESLFIPADDDEQRWEPAEPGDEDGDMLDWDASADNVGERLPLDLMQCSGSIGRILPPNFQRRYLALATA